MRCDQIAQFVTNRDRELLRGIHGLQVSAQVLKTFGVSLCSAFPGPRASAIDQAVTRREFDRDVLPGFVLADDARSPCFEVVDPALDFVSPATLLGYGERRGEPIISKRL